MIRILLISFFIITSTLLSRDLPIESIKTIKVGNGIEPSGICKVKNSVVVISDNGYVWVDGKIHEIVDDADYEGIECFDNYYYVVEEGKDRILKLDIHFNILETIEVSRRFHGKKVTKKKGNGFESLAVIRNKFNDIEFFVTNQSNKFKGKDRSAILHIDRFGHILNYYPKRIKDMSAMMYLKKYNQFIVVSDKLRTIFIMDKNFKIIKRYKMPFKDIEGIYMDGNILYLAQDSGNILIIKLKKRL